MQKPKQPPEKAVRAVVGDLRDRFKARCAILGITMQEGLIEAMTFWLKEGRKKEKAA